MGPSFKFGFSVKTLAIVTVLAHLSFCQDPEDLKKTSPTLTRSRILIGYSNFIQKNRKPELSNYFMNYNYRMSGFNPFDKSLRLGMALELGLNAAYSENDHDGITAVIPYIKTGPELLIAKNLIAGASFGLASIYYGYIGIAFAFYGGLNSYYLITLNKNSYIELEGGFHSVFPTREPSYLVYLSTGIGFN